MAVIPAEFVGSTSFTSNGGYVTISIPKIQNTTSYGTTGSLEVVLWYTSSPYNGGTITGYEVATVPYTNRLGPNQYFNPTTFTTSFNAAPDDGTYYYATLALEEYDGSLGRYVIVDYVNYLNTIPVEFVGSASFTVSGGSVSITVPKIQNTTSDGTTGSLEAVLWYTSSVYNGGTIHGYEVATVPYTNVLGPNQFFSPTTISEPFTIPPDGIYYATLALEEYDGINSEYVIVDYVNFDSSPRQIEALGSTTLAETGNVFRVSGGVVSNLLQYLMRDASGNGPSLRYGGTGVSVGDFGAWAPFAAEKTATGYEVAWRYGSDDLYIVWNTDAAGNYIGSATETVRGVSASLEVLEASFRQDLNNDGTIGLKLTGTVESLGATRLGRVGSELVMLNSAGSGPILRQSGSTVTDGQFGAWAPIAAEKTVSGYEVAWRYGTDDAYIVWNTDPNGNYTGTATDVVKGVSASLELLEASFQQDLNKDGTIGVKLTSTIESLGATRIGRVGPEFVMLNSAGSGPILRQSGNSVTDGQFGPWAPIGAEKTAGGYMVAWRYGTDDQYIVWNTDAAGNYTGTATDVVRGVSASVEVLEASFQQDLNKDGTIGVKLTSAIESLGATRLGWVGADLVMLDSAGSGPILRQSGSIVTDGRFGAWTPIAAEKTANGYEVAWRYGTDDRYIVWNTDNSGAWTNFATGAVKGASAALQLLESSFQQDLNKDGTIGAKTTSIETAGVTKLVQVVDLFYLRDSDNNGPSLKFQGADVVADQFGAWKPIGAEKTATGYQMAWQFGTGDQYIIWNTDAGGNWTKFATDPVKGASTALQLLEPSFQQDLNKDGTVGVKTTSIETAGVTKLTQIADHYYLRDSAGNGPVLKFQGADIVTDQFGAWKPIAAEKTATGYEVAWQFGTDDQYIVWNTDSSGSWTSYATGAVKGASGALGLLEPSFQQDLNKDGTIGAKITSIEAVGVTKFFQVADQFYLRDSAGNGPSLKFQGVDVVADQFGTWKPIGADVSETGYAVAWKFGNADQFVLWNLDTSGNFINYRGSTPMSGLDFTLERAESLFAQDLNGDHWLGFVTWSAAIKSTVFNDPTDLRGFGRSLTIDVGGNDGRSLSGLSAASQVIVGTPANFKLGTPADRIEYSLAPGSGIVTVSGFDFGQDSLNVDLMGAPTATLKVYDTSVSGQHAIAVTSASDSAHGVLLLNIAANHTANEIVANHLAFAGGHALIF